MSDESMDIHGPEAILRRLREQVENGNMRFSAHALDEMEAEETGLITSREVLEVLLTGQVLENYPSYYKGPCGLIAGKTKTDRPLHVVCSTSLPRLVIITVYQPTPPGWLTSTQRGGQS